MNLANKTFIVTGGGNGVGRALVTLLLEKNARVAAVDINQEALEQTAVLVGSNAERLSLHRVDVTDRAAVESLPQQVHAHHPSIDGIINNAGIIHPFKHVSDSDYDTIHRVFNINFFGTLYFSKAFLPYLLARPEAYIINVASFGALSPVPGETIYGASKAAVKMLTDGLLFELAKTHVHVLAAIPGGINSNIIGNSSAGEDLSVEQLRKKFAFLLLSPEKAARRIISGIEKNRKRITLGFDAQLIDFLSRLSPRVAPRLIYQVIDKLLGLKRIESNS